jgi:hypothetical protein
MSLTIEAPAETKAMRRSGTSLSGYLNDALTSETLAVDLIERAIADNDGTRVGAFLTLLSWELEEDRESLVRLMGALGVRPKHVGVALARLAEKLARLRRKGSSPQSLSRDLESLHLRIDRKLDTWNALRSSAGDRVDGIDVDELIHRTERQAEQLERRRGLERRVVSERYAYA